jgi:hypothetical protein
VQHQEQFLAQATAAGWALDAVFFTKQDAGLMLPEAEMQGAAGKKDQ